MAAPAAGDARDHHPIAYGDAIDRATDLDDDADGFVPDTQPVDRRQIAVVKVQIRSADPGSLHGDDGPLRSRQCRVGPVRDVHRALAVHDHRTHTKLLLVRTLNQRLDKSSKTSSRMH